MTFSGPYLALQKGEIRANTVLISQKVDGQGASRAKDGLLSTVTVTEKSNGLTYIRLWLGSK